MKTINSSLLSYYLSYLSCSLSSFPFLSFFSLYPYHLPFFHHLFFLPFSILPYKHRDQCTGTAFGRWKMIWRALIDLKTHRPFVSFALCKCYFFSNRMLRHRLAPLTSAQKVIKSRSFSLIYQRLHVSSGLKSSALICCPTSDETMQYIRKLFI